jgi:hypothetical protein
MENWHRSSKSCFAHRDDWRVSLKKSDFQCQPVQTDLVLWL